MDIDGRASDAASEGTGAQMQPSAGGRDLGAASLADVLFEQLDFLIGHAATSADCPSTCGICVRLDNVAQHLLAPFQSALL
jgi:hypothetical protein